MHRIVIRHSLFAELQPKYKEEANYMGPWWRDCVNGFHPSPCNFAVPLPEEAGSISLSHGSELVMVNKVRWREWYSQPSESLPVSACSLLHLHHPHERGVPRLARWRARDTWSRARSPQLPQLEACLADS